MVDGGRGADSLHIAAYNYGSVYLDGGQGNELEPRRLGGARRSMALAARPRRDRNGNELDGGRTP